MKLLENKSLHTRRRIAVIWTGILGIVLILVLVFIYAHPHTPKHDPEAAIASGYSTVLHSIGSLFHKK